MMSVSLGKIHFAIFYRKNISKNQSTDCVIAALLQPSIEPKFGMSLDNTFVDDPSNPGHRAGISERARHVGRVHQVEFGHSLYSRKGYLEESRAKEADEAGFEDSDRLNNFNGTDNEADEDIASGDDPVQDTQSRSKDTICEIIKMIGTDNSGQFQRSTPPPPSPSSLPSPSPSPPSSLSPPNNHGNPPDAETAVFWSESNDKVRLLFDSEHKHIPEGNPYDVSECELHEWALEGLEGEGEVDGHKRKKVKGELMWCPTCGIISCLSCWKLFHTVEDLDDLAADIQSYLQGDDDVRSTVGPMVCYTHRCRMKRVKVDGKIVMRKTNHRLQGRCLECNRKTSAMCSECAEEDGESSDGGKRNSAWVCDRRTGRSCCVTHFSKFH